MIAEAAPATRAPATRFADSAAAEWIKLRTLRSTYLSIAVAIVAVVGIAAVSAAVVSGHWARMVPADRAGFDPVMASLDGWYLGQLVIGVLGVLVMSSEYGNGMITVTFGATPRRRRVLLSKVAVLTAVVLVIAEATSLAAFSIAQAILTITTVAGRPTSIGVSLGDPGVARAVLGAGLYVSLIGLLGLGIGAIVRSTAGAITALLSLLFLPPILADAFPLSWHKAIQEYSPMNAGSQILHVHPSSDALGPWGGLGTLALYALAALVVALLLIDRRDA